MFMAVDFSNVLQSPELWELIVSILGLILSAVVPILANQVRIFILAKQEQLEAQIGAEKLDTLERFITNMIRAAEQTFDLEDNEMKKDFVVSLAYDFTQQLNLPLTLDQIEALVEGVFNGLKPELA